MAKWLDEHPIAAQKIGMRAVLDLYFPDGSDEVLSEHDDFPSGADYIDEICRTLRVTKILKLLLKLQESATKRQESEQEDAD